MYWRSQLLFAIAAFLLIVPVTSSSGKNAVERPYRSTSTNVWTVNMLDGSAIGHEVGRGTHLGRYTNEAEAIWNFADPQNPVIVSGSGTATAANGDQVFWKMTADQPGVVQIIGGTGRFVDATGLIVAVLPYKEVVATVDLETMTMYLEVTYKAVGTITY